MHARVPEMPLIKTIFKHDYELCKSSNTDLGTIQIEAGEVVDLVPAEWSDDSDEPLFDGILYNIWFLQLLLHNRFDPKTLLIKGKDGALYSDRQSCATMFMHSLLSLMKTDPKNFGEYAPKKSIFLDTFFSQPENIYLAKKFIDQHSCHDLVRKSKPQLYVKLFPPVGILSMFQRSRRSAPEIETFSNVMSTRDVESGIPIAQIAEHMDLNIANIPTALEVDTNDRNRGSIPQIT